MGHLVFQPFDLMCKGIELFGFGSYNTLFVFDLLVYPCDIVSRILEMPIDPRTSLLIPLLYLLAQLINDSIPSALYLRLSLIRQVAFAHGVVRVAKPSPKTFCHLRDLRFAHLRDRYTSFWWGNWLIARNAIQTGRQGYRSCVKPVYLR
jgi:hypothetical protein